MQKGIAASSAHSPSERRCSRLGTKKSAETAKLYDHPQAQDHGGIQWMREIGATEHGQKF